MTSSVWVECTSLVNLTCHVLTCSSLDTIFDGDNRYNPNIFVHDIDLSTEHARMLLPNALAELPSTSQEIKAYLADLTGLRVPVLPKFFSRMVSDNGLMKDLLAPTDDSLLPASLSTLLSKASEDHGSELTTTVCICSYFDTVFPALHMYSDMQLVYKIYLNKAETGTSSSILQQQSQTRPDAFLVANSCLLLGALCALECFTVSAHYIRKSRLFLLVAIYIFLLSVQSPRSSLREGCSRL